jgi:hypothetical protein
MMARYIGAIFGKSKPVLAHTGSKKMFGTTRAEKAGYCNTDIKLSGLRSREVNDKTLEGDNDIMEDQTLQLPTLDKDDDVSRYGSYIKLEIVDAFSNTF